MSTQCPHGGRVYGPSAAGQRRQDGRLLGRRHLRPGSAGDIKSLFVVFCGIALVVGVVVAVLFRAQHTNLPSKDGDKASESTARTPAQSASAAPGTAQPSTPAKREPTEAEKREGAAEDLHHLAAQKGADENWQAVIDQLDLLAAKYADTQYLAAHRQEVKNLREMAVGKLPSQPSAGPSKGGEPSAKADAKSPAKADAASPTRTVVEEPPRQGLLGVFYSGEKFDKFLRVTRHPGPYFAWSPDYPGQGVPGEHMSAKFVGQLQLREPGKYLFRFKADGGARLYLDGKLILNEWATAKHGQFRRAELDRGMHSLWIEYKAGDATGSFALKWEQGGVETQVPDEACFWDPALWKRVVREPGHDPLVGMKPSPVEAPPEPADVAEKTEKTDKEAPTTPLGVAAKALGVLRPLWAKRQYAEAASQAKAIAADPDYAAAPEVGKQLVEEAQALVDFWKAVEAGAAKLEPGETLRVCGISGEFQKVERGSISITQGSLALTKPLTALNNDELVSLVRRAGAAKTGPDHLRLALFWQTTAKPDLAKARAELALAKEAGVDVSRFPSPAPPPKP